MGHTILVIIYYLLTRGTLYEDLGATYFNQRDHTRVKRHLVRRLQALGYTVRLEPPSPDGGARLRRAKLFTAGSELSKSQVSMSLKTRRRAADA